MARTTPPAKGSKPPKPKEPKIEADILQDAEFEQEAGEQVENDDPLANKLYEKWEGRVELKQIGVNARDNSPIFSRKFNPLVKLRPGTEGPKPVKITEQEAEIMNIGAIDTGHTNFVIIYLPLGTGEAGKKVKRKDIIKEQEEIKEDEED
jgi:hypothetical protein